MAYEVRSRSPSQPYYSSQDTSSDSDKSLSSSTSTYSSHDSEALGNNGGKAVNRTRSEEHGSSKKNQEQLKLDLTRVNPQKGIRSFSPRVRDSFSRAFQGRASQSQPSSPLSKDSTPKKISAAISLVTDSAKNNKGSSFFSKVSSPRNALKTPFTITEETAINITKSNLDYYEYLELEPPSPKNTPTTFDREFQKVLLSLIDQSNLEDSIPMDVDRVIRNEAESIVSGLCSEFESPDDFSVKTLNTITLKFSKLLLENIVAKELLKPMLEKRINFLRSIIAYVIKESGNNFKRTRWTDGFLKTLETITKEIQKKYLLIAVKKIISCQDESTKNLILRVFNCDKEIAKSVLEQTLQWVRGAAADRACQLITETLNTAINQHRAENQILLYRMPEDFKESMKTIDIEIILNSYLQGTLIAYADIAVNGTKLDSKKLRDEMSQLNISLHNCAELNMIHSQAKVLYHEALFSLLKEHGLKESSEVQELLLLGSEQTWKSCEEILRKNFPEVFSGSLRTQLSTKKSLAVSVSNSEVQRVAGVGNFKISKISRKIVESDKSLIKSEALVNLEVHWAWDRLDANNIEANDARSRWVLKVQISDINNYKASSETFSRVLRILATPLDYNGEELPAAENEKLKRVLAKLT